MLQELTNEGKPVDYTKMRRIRWYGLGSPPMTPEVRALAEQHKALLDVIGSKHHDMHFQDLCWAIRFALGKEHPLLVVEDLRETLGVLVLAGLVTVASDWR